MLLLQRKDRPKKVEGLIGCRCVGRSNNNANANGGLSYANANNAFSNSNSNNGARIANNSELESACHKMADYNMT